MSAPLNPFKTLKNLLVRHAPDADGVVGVARVEDAAVSRPGDGRALGLDGLLLCLGDQLSNHILVLQIVDADGTLTGSAEPVPVRREADLVDRLIAVELVEVLTAAQIPQTSSSVLAG